MKVLVSDPIAENGMSILKYAGRFVQPFRGCFDAIRGDIRRIVVVELLTMKHRR